MSGPEPTGEGRFSPAVLRLAAEHRIDLKAVPGTGMNGRITRKDVTQFIERGGAAPAPASAAGAPVSASPAPVPSTPAPGALSPTAPAPATAPTPPAATDPATVAPTPARAPAVAGEDEEIIKPSAT